MPAIRGLSVSVGQHYAWTTGITMPLNLRHMVEHLIVTAPGDPVLAVVDGWPGVRVLETDAFTRYGARFNKGLAMEEGLTALGRDGWICIHDADCVWPEVLPLGDLRDDALHGCRRRILEDVSRWSPDLDWRLCPQVRDGGPIGFFQLFRADAPSLRGKMPWYDVSFSHAGGGDAYFISLWAKSAMVILNAEVLHLGPNDTNWFGADDVGREIMAAYVHRNGWRRAMRKADPTAQHRVGQIDERVQVPGYPPSHFELPFVKRARASRRAR